VFALLIGLVSGRFMGSDMRTYLPFFITGMTIWNFISSTIGEATMTLVYAGGMIKASNMPLAFFVMRMAQRNFIIFMHNAAIIPVIWLVYRWHLGPTTLLAIFGLGIVYVFTVGTSLLVSIICARFRDIPPFIATLLQFLFLTSPIIWVPEQLHAGHFIVKLNPVSYLMAVARDPIIGRPVGASVWLSATAAALVAVSLGIYFYARYRKRVVFWV
jgi:lipopolysaccharide transport system permease protein